MLSVKMVFCYVLAASILWLMVGVVLGWIACVHDARTRKKKK